MQANGYLDPEKFEMCKADVGRRRGMRPLRWPRFQKFLLCCWHRVLLIAFLYFSETTRGVSSVTQDLDSVVRILSTLQEAKV
jgi:hypothetical protein